MDMLLINTIVLKNRPLTQICVSGLFCVRFAMVKAIALFFCPIFADIHAHKP
mgnify:CR=1 FL=1